MFLILLNPRELSKKIKTLKPDKLREDAIYLNELLPEDLRTFTIKSESIEGVKRDLLLKINQLIQVLNHRAPSVYKEFVEFIHNQFKEKEKEDKPPFKIKEISKHENEVNLKKFNEFLISSKVNLQKQPLRKVLNDGINIFKKINKIKKTIVFLALRELIQDQGVTKPDKLVWEYTIEDSNKVERSLEDFFKKLNKFERICILIGFSFWGNFCNELKEKSENIYLSWDLLPIISIKIYNMITLIINDLYDSQIKLDIRELFNDIYDKTEGFTFNIEPWCLL